MIYNLYERCLRHYSDVAHNEFVVKEAIPIPYFGDLPEYRKSERRILTAALNPSDVEFPRNGVARFDVPSGSQGAQELEKELVQYFKRSPYRKWFSSFAHVLSGMKATYGGHLGIQDAEPSLSTALHIDLLSPIATNPTWSGLSNAQKGLLTVDGKELFELLVQALEPEIIVSSVGWDHLGTWDNALKHACDWPIIVRHETTKSGSMLRNPLLVRAKEIVIAGRCILFANASAADTPFGRFSNTRKREAGEAILAEFQKRYL